MTIPSGYEKFKLIYRIYKHNIRLILIESLFPDH